MNSITTDRNAVYETEADLARLAAAAEQRSRYAPHTLSVFELVVLREKNGTLGEETAFYVEPDGTVPCQVKTRAGMYRLDIAERTTTGLIRAQYSRRS